MPLAKATVEYLATKPPVKKHVIDSRAAGGKVPPRLKQIYDASCESWAYTASKGGLLPSAVCSDILMEDGTPTVVKKGHKLFGAFQGTYAAIREKFGYFDHQTLPPSAGAKARNAKKEELAMCVRMVMENCLEHNGFKLSKLSAKTDYAICTEYEMAKNQAMYPNHTHSWLEYKGKVCAQTIPGTHLSLVRHHAGRPAHASIVRVYVQDFLPDQNTTIDEIVANAAEQTAHVLNCNLNVDIGTLKLTHEMHSPNE